MDYTCENCKSRGNWRCKYRYEPRCDRFELDEGTLSWNEKEVLRAMRYVLREEVEQQKTSNNEKETFSNVLGLNSNRGELHGNN